MKREMWEGDGNAKGVEVGRKAMAMAKLKHLKTLGRRGDGDAEGLKKSGRGGAQRRLVV